MILLCVCLKILYIEVRLAKIVKTLREFTYGALQHLIQEFSEKHRRPYCN